MQIQELHRLGMSQSPIARQLSLDCKTVRKYLRTPPGKHGPQRPPPSKLEPHDSYLRERCEHGVRDARELFLELTECGYRGGEGG